MAFEEGYTLGGEMEYVNKKCKKLTPEQAAKNVRSMMAEVWSLLCNLTLTYLSLCVRGLHSAMVEDEARKLRV